MKRILNIIHLISFGFLATIFLLLIINSYESQILLYRYANQLGKMTTYVRYTLNESMDLKKENNLLRYEIQSLKKKMIVLNTKLDSIPRYQEER